jgi:hypothetical protein
MCESPANICDPESGTFQINRGLFNMATYATREIIKMILVYLDLATLAAMAQASKRLHEDSIVPLWHSLDCITPLFSLFPSDIVLVEKGRIVSPSSTVCSYRIPQS